MVSIFPLPNARAVFAQFCMKFPCSESSLASKLGFWMIWKALCTWCVPEDSFQSGSGCPHEAFSYSVYEESVVLDSSVSGHLWRGIMLSWLSFPVLRTSGSGCVQNCLLYVERSSKDKIQELPEFLFPCATRFQPSPTYHSCYLYKSVSALCTKKNSKFGCLQFSVAIARGQVHYRRLFGASALEKKSLKARFALRNASVWAI